MVVFTDVDKEKLAKLLRKGYKMDTPKTVYEDLRLKKGDVSLILYTSGKLLLQGKKDQMPAIIEELNEKGIGEKQPQKRFRKQEGTFIGSDETLKGDTFGGLVVAAVKADEKQRVQLRELGVNDSKKLSDHEIITLAQKIRTIVPCDVKSLLPEKYNGHKGNVTELLNKLHLESANALGPATHVVDKYPGCAVGDIQEERAESKYVEVAAASILAREAALRQFNYLSKMAGFPIPKGSTHVALALHELQDKKLDPKYFVKLHFKNVQKALG